MLSIEFFPSLLGKAWMFAVLSDGAGHGTLVHVPFIVSMEQIYFTV